MIDSTDEARLSESKEAFGESQPDVSLGFTASHLRLISRTAMMMMVLFMLFTVFIWLLHPCLEQMLSSVYLITCKALLHASRKCKQAESSCKSRCVTGMIQMLTITVCHAEKMISSEALEGVPLLVLANKQDVPVLCGPRDLLRP